MSGLYLLHNAKDISQGYEAFSQLLWKAFAYAEDNSHGTDAVKPNQAAILALGVIPGDEFQTVYGGLGGTNTLAIFTEIDRRISELEALR